jgi:hypothetical protein
VDGTLLPCWSWAGHKELYSGKHKTTGMNVQVACTIYGKFAWISDPVNGSRHDNYCLGESDHPVHQVIPRTGGWRPGREAGMNRWPTGEAPERVHTRYTAI